ncbi:MAG: EAL domain-containing protein [Burkholderiaceae bacterium]|nr:EAL domain-containing protein [Burkholderiaceae bacterium]
MNWLPVISVGLNLMMGLALLMLWNQDRRHRYVLLWGWSWVLLSLGLLLGPILIDERHSPALQQAEALGSACALMGSLLLQVAGALQYRERHLPLKVWLPLLLAMVLALALTAARSQTQAVALGALFLVCGALISAFLMARGGSPLELWVALGFVLLAGVHGSSPLLHEMGRSPITSTLGIFAQTLLSLSLILLAMARANDEVRRQSRRFQKIAQHSLQGMAVLQDGKVLYANPAALAIFGYHDRERVTGETGSDTLIPLEQQQASAARHRAILADPMARVAWEGPRLNRLGHKLYLRGLSSYMEWDGRPAELVTIMDDTARQAALKALQRQAIHDELTNLPNRNFAVERLQQLTAEGAAFAVISADLDRFQLVNETLGHATGDALLRAVGERLRLDLPPEASVARLGEDQFVILLEGAALASAVQVFVEQLLALLERPFALAGTELQVHMSVGVALFPQDGDDGATLLRGADAAMHKAKQRAGSTYEFFDAGMNRASQARLQAEQALAKAIEGREFFLEYQPKYRAGSRQLCGFEALVRWQPAGGARVSPVDFIPAAERTGHIHALGDLILAMATAQLHGWLDQFGQLLPVAVNVSPLQFEDVLFVERLMGHLQGHGLPPDCLEVEITETAAIGHVDRVVPMLQRLHELGVESALDDFGTGQSSLTMLRRLPIQTMKLDRSMIDPLPAADASAVVQAVCLLGQSLKLQIVAEGVENETQAQAVEALGCTQLQGFHLSRPLSAAAATALLKARLGRWQTTAQL